MNISFSCVESRVENNKNIYGRFILAPFLPGHAVTLANGLRRCLLSEVYGVAITAIEINGVKHEYSTITGVRESVLEILLNVREIVLTSELQFQRPQIAFLQVQGPGVVKASDIKLPISIQNVKPEQHIATLLYDGVLNMKFMICCGKNFLVQTPRGLKTPKVLNQTLPQKIAHFKTTIQTKKKKIAYTKFSTYLKKQKDLDQNFVNKPNIFYNKVGKAMSNFVLTSLSLKKKKRIIAISNKLNKHIKKTNGIRYLDSFTSVKKKKIKTYRDYLIQYCKREKKDLVFTEYLFKLKEKKWKSFLPIDAVFAPVSRVNFAIENNDLSNAPKERINLEIWTNGSLHPIQAIIEAAKAFTDITLFLKDITNNKCLFINSPNKFIKMLLFQKSLNQILQRNQEIQKHYLTIKTQNKQRRGGVITSEDGVPKPMNQNVVPFMTEKGVLELSDIIEHQKQIERDLKKMRRLSASYFRPPKDTDNKDTDNKDTDNKYTDNKYTDTKHVSRKAAIIQVYRPGKEKVQIETGFDEKKRVLLFEWVTRVRTIREFAAMLPLHKVSTELARNLTIECEQINKDFNQFNSTIDIGNLGLSLRPYTCLKQAKIENLGDLLQNSAEDLLNLKNFGKHSLNEVENILNQYHLKLSSQKMDEVENK